MELKFEELASMVFSHPGKCPAHQKVLSCLRPFCAWKTVFVLVLPKANEEYVILACKS